MPEVGRINLCDTMIREGESRQQDGPSQSRGHALLPPPCSDAATARFICNHMLIRSCRNDRDFVAGPTTTLGRRPS